jgi:hypothetical protein
MGYAQADDCRTRVETLIQRASEIGSSVEQDRAELWKLWEILIKDIEASVVLWGVDANKALEHASAAHRLSRERLIRFGNFAAAQIVREDIPFPKEEIPPFILSHDPDTIMQLMDFLEPEAKADFRSFGASLLRSAREEGFAIPEAEEKLKAMRHDAFSRKNFCWFRIHEKQTATRMKFAAVTI